MKKGDEVNIELYYTDDVIPGVVKRVQAGAAFIELSEPIHFMTETKQVIIPSVIHPDMCEPMTDLLGYGTAQFLEMIGKLPAGNFTPESERTYKLKKPMRLKTIIDLCRDSEQRREPRCWLQSAYLNVIPIQV